MATATATKPQRTPQEVEDIIIRKIFLVSITGESTTTTGATDSRIVYLELTAAEILSEGKDLLLSRDVMERVLIDRLSGDFTVAGVESSTFHYLVGCYNRAHDESKKIVNMKDKNLRSEIETVIKQAKKLCVSYCRIQISAPVELALEHHDRRYCL